MNDQRQDLRSVFVAVRHLPRPWFRRLRQLRTELRRNSAFRRAETLHEAPDEHDRERLSKHGNQAPQHQDGKTGVNGGLAADGIGNGTPHNPS